MSIRLTAAFVLILLTFVTGSAFAGLVVDANTIIDMAGMGEMNITVTQYFDENMSHTKSNSTNAMGMSINTAEIVRIDKGVQWILAPDKKKYAEIPFEQIKTMTTASDTIPPQSGGYDWTLAYTGIENPEPVAGIDCRGVAAMATGVKADDPTDTVMIEFKQYYADKFAGSDQLTVFRDAYKEGTGLDDQLFSQLKGNPIMAAYGVGLKQIADTLANESGTPLMTYFAMSVTKSPMPNAPEGMNTILSITNEITSIKEEDLADSMFAIPEGFTQTDIQSLMRQ